MKQLYNEKEIGAILRKAAENTARNASDGSVGLSIDELKLVASEAGIDPDQIQTAISELESAGNADGKSFWGGPFSYSRTVELDHVVTPDEWEEMLVSIRAFFGSKGQVTARESVYEWSSPEYSTNSAHVTVLKMDGKSRITTTWSGPMTGLPFYLPVPLAAIGGILIASGVLELSAVPGFAFAFLVAASTFMAGRWALRRHLKKGFERLSRLTVGFGAMAGSEPSEPVANVSPAAALPDRPSGDEAAHPRASTVLSLDETEIHASEPDRISRTRSRG